MLLTHRHDDHFGGLKQVVQTVGIRLFMDAPIEHTGSAYEALLETLEERKVPVRQAERGRTIDLGDGATLTLLSPPAPPIRGAFEGEREQRGRAARLPRAGRAVRGRCRAGDRTLVAVAAVTAAGAHPQGRAPRRPLLVDGAIPGGGAAGAGGGLGGRAERLRAPDARGAGRLQKVGARVMRTDQDGTITIVTDGTRIDVSTERGKHALLSPPPP